MRAYSVMLFVISLNLAAFILQQSGVSLASKQLYISPFDITNQFSLAVFGALAIGGGIIGVIGLITRQYVYASVALVIWVMGLLLPVAQWFLLGLPIMMSVLLPPEVSYLTYVVSAFFAVIFFMFMVEIASQRYVT